MRRDDITESLVHLTRGTPKEAADRFGSIYDQQVLRDGDPSREYGPRICFSEAPVSKIGHILAFKDHAFRYQPFGVTVRKSWLYQRGGRPVIYQPSEDRAKLDASLRYLHQNFDPAKRKKDYTWEREWRIPVAELPLDAAAMTLIVPNRAWEYWAREAAAHRSSGARW